MVQVWMVFFSLIAGSSVYGEEDILLATDASTMEVANGSMVVLNCTILGPLNSTQIAADDLSWYLGHKQLVSSTAVGDKRTKQLVFNSISWENTGQYWCRLSSASTYHIPGVSVSVVVGDIPGPPQIFKWENVECNLKLYWYAPSYDGGLSLQYCFTYTGANSIDCHDSSFYSFADGLYSSFFKLDHRFNEHRVWIEAKNTLGCAKSDPKDVNWQSEKVHPCQVHVTSIKGKSKAVELHWKRDQRPECTLSSYYTYVFNISYREQGELHFKSRCIKSGPTKLRLNSLKSHTFYSVLVSFHLEDDYGFRSLPSSVVGPFSVWTKEEAPSEGPTNISCKATAWPKDKRKMNVTLKWKPPSRSKWNGFIRSYQVRYRDSMDNESLSVIVGNDSARRLVFSGLNSSSAYRFILRACTTDQSHCSSAKQCTAKLNSSLGTRTEVVPQTSREWLVILTPIAAVVFCLAVFVTIGLIVYCRRKMKHLSGQPSSDNSQEVDEQQNLITLTSEVAPSECPFPEFISWREQAEYCEIKDSDEESTDSVLLHLD